MAPSLDKMRHYSFSLLVLLIFAVLAIVPGVGADENTTDPYHYLTHGDHLAGPRDMSMYSVVITPKPHPAANNTLTRDYPNASVCGKDGCIPKSACPFPFITCQNPLTLQIVYNVNASRPQQPGPVVLYCLNGWPLLNPIYLIPAGTIASSLSYPGNQYGN